MCGKEGDYNEFLLSWQKPKKEQSQMDKCYMWADILMVIFQLYLLSEGLHSEGLPQQKQQCATHLEVTAPLHWLWLQKVHHTHVYVH